MLYLLNSPVLSDFGVWRYTGPVSVVEAAEMLRAAPEFVSAIGHESTAQLMSELLGFAIEKNRVTVSMQPGDRALVFSVKRRMPEGVVLSSEDLRRVPFEIGL